MQMVNCDKCGKPIDHTHWYSFRVVKDDYDASIVSRTIAHVNCADPICTPEHLRNLKLGPAFDTQTPNQRQISQNEIYNKS